MIFFDIVFIPVLLLISVASFVHILWMLFVRPSPILRHYRIRIFLALFIAPVIGISVAFNLNMVGPFFLLAWIFACPTVWLILTLEKREFRPILFAGFWCGAVAWMALALSEGSLSFGLAMHFWYVFVPFALIAGSLSALVFWFIAFYSRRSPPILS